jgi:phosphate-selective porin OprO and OprP
LSSDRGVTPRRRFDPEAGTWGAFQIAARYASLQIDPDTFTLGLASAGASRRADAAGVSATWYPNQYVKYVLSYERTVFDQAPDGPRRAEHAVVFRLQVNVQPSS